MTNEEKLDRLLALLEGNTVIVLPKNDPAKKEIGTSLSPKDYAAICIRYKAKAKRI